MSGHNSIGHMLTREGWILSRKYVCRKKSEEIKKSNERKGWGGEPLSSLGLLREKKDRRRRKNSEGGEDREWGIVKFESVIKRHGDRATRSMR